MDNSLAIKDSDLYFKNTEIENLMLMYSSALKTLENKISVINNEFRINNSYNPIEHVKTRIKSPKSILGKLKKKGLEPTYENIVENINDIAGMRIVCSFIPDIYTIVNIIENFDDIRIIERKDYVNKPKSSGYSSYHMIIEVPIQLSNGTKYVKAEIQIRTVAMDFWASLEHKINYKYDGNVSKSVLRDLKSCAKIVSRLDNKMLELSTKRN